MHDIDHMLEDGTDLSSNQRIPFTSEKSEQHTVLGEILAEARTAGGCENPAADRGLPPPDAVIGGFLFREWVVQKSAKDTILGIAGMIRRGVTGPILLIGHTDPVGTHEYNCGLGRRRA